MPRPLPRLAAAILLAATSLPLAAPSANAVPLATLPVRLFSDIGFDGGSSLIHTSTTYSFWVAPANVNNEIGSGFLMLRFSLSEANLGQTLVASALNMGSAFTAGAAQLTDSALNDYVSAATESPFGGGAGSGTTEIGVPLDLRGQTLGSIHLIVDDISFVVPGSNPNRDGQWVDYTFNGRLVFDSEAPAPPPAATPEPGSLGLLGAALGLLAARRRQRSGS